MGYTHYWAYPPTDPVWARAWPEVVRSTHVIIAHARRAGIDIAGPDGHGGALAREAEGVAFNGAAVAGLHGAPFQLLAPLPHLPGRQPTATAYCTTSGKPYDAAVAALLLRCRLLLPGTFRIASDGRWDTEWARGAMTQPGQPLSASARGICGEVFINSYPVSSPLSTIRDVLGPR
jgi:hypothetical protein